MEISSRAVLPAGAEDGPEVNDGDGCCEDVGSNLSSDDSLCGSIQTKMIWALKLGESLLACSLRQRSLFYKHVKDLLLNLNTNVLMKFYFDVSFLCQAQVKCMEEDSVDEP